MELKQHRNFEALVGDTFGFIGRVWRHFLPTMIQINFIYLIATCVLAYFAFTWIGESGSVRVSPDVFGAMSMKMPSSGFSEYAGDLSSVLKENTSLIPLMGLFYLLMAVGLVIFMAFTPAYMILYSRTGNVPSVREIVAFLKKKALRLLVYCFGMLLLSIPVLVVAIPLCIFLVVTIVGIVLIPLVVLVLAIMASLILFAYLDDDNIGFFDSIDVAWKALKNGFWRNTAANVLVYVVGMFFALLPRLLISAFSSMDFMEEAPGLVFLGVAYVLAVLVMNLMISAFYSVNVGLVYFSGQGKKNGAVLE